MLPGLKAWAVGLVVAGAGLGQIYDLAGRPAWHTTLPDDLSEISGMAFSPDGRLFAHGDENAVVHRLDPRSGKILGSFALAATGREPDLGKKAKATRAGGGAVAGDFEDIAIVGDRFFLVASTGVLLEFTEGRSGGLIRYAAHATGLGQVCEIEGLAHDAPTRPLLLLCKDGRSKGGMTEVQVWAWSLDGGSRRRRGSRFQSASWPVPPEPQGSMGRPSP